MRRMISRAAIISLCLALTWGLPTTTPVRAEEFGAGQLPITYLPQRPAQLAPTEIIEISGSVGGGGPATIALRIDDKWNATFAERFNLERSFPEGPFTWRVPASDVKTGAGNVLNLKTIRQLVLFTTAGGPVQVTAFRSVPGAPTPPVAQPAAPTGQPSTAGEVSFGVGALPITHIPDAPLSLAAPAAIEISGTVGGSGPATITLRLDDKWNATYAERANLERTFPAGPFTWRVPANEIRTGAGRALNLGTIRQLVLFTTSAGPVEVASFRKVADGAVAPVPVVAASPPVSASTSFGVGTLPITHIPEPALSLSAPESIEITGAVGGNGPATITLRLDDKWNATYAERANLERTFPAGPFTWRVSANEIRTGDGRALNLGTIRQLVLFATAGGPVSVTTFGKFAGDAVSASVAAAPAPAQAASAAGMSLGEGNLPITYAPPNPASLAASEVIEIVGRAQGGPATIVLRVDDKWNATYGERANLERSIAAGPFTWRVPASAIKTGSGRALDLQSIRQIVLFVNSGGPVEVSTFRKVAAASAPAAAAPAAQPPSNTTVKRDRPAGAAPPSSLGTGRATIRFEQSGTINATGRQIIVEGTVEGRDVQSVVLRIDDVDSHDYSSRISIERTLPPGPFRFELGVDGLRTPNRRTIDASNVKRVIFGPYPETRNVIVTRFDLLPIAGLPDGAKGYALGLNEATLPAGFERIAVGDPRLTGRSLEARRRIRPDPLVANGIRGLSRIRLPAEPGRARVTVWSEDPGDWELLPQVLRRSIRVNGVTLVDEKLTPQQWLVGRYLRGRWQEHDAASDAWTAFGARRGDRRTVEVDVARDGITIEVDGDSAEERFVNAVLVEKAGSTRALEQVERARAEWFRSNWRVVAPTDKAVSWTATGLSGVTRVKIAVPPVEVDKSTAGSLPMRAKAAPGTGVRLVLEASATQRIEKPVFRITEPKRSGGGPALPTRAWAGLWKLTQRDTRVSLLTLWDEQLMADVSRLDIKAEGEPGFHPRRYELWIEVPSSAPPGLYSGSVGVGADAAIRDVPLEIEVLPVALPPPSKPAGFYLTHPPHLAWRGATRLDRERQAVCDMSYLVRFGLSGSAPPVSAPLRDGFDIMTGEMQAARNAGLAPGWLLYDPLRTLRDAYGDARAASIGAGAVEALKRRNLPLPVFTAADEPGNPEQFTTGLQGWLTALRRASPEMKLAGHLNQPGDQALAPHFDVALINEGFGIDLATIDRLAKTGKSVWIYNTFEPRLTAGFWLTYSRAERYLQWHGRMPTADPFDPLDGRELDVQVIYPGETICAPAPDIHRDLLRLAEGVVDQRWLLWLEQRTEPAMRQLANKLRSTLGSTWAGATRQTDNQLSQLRSEIMALAGSLPK